MSAIEFSDGEKEIIIDKVKSYFESELGQEIGQFDAEFLLEFFSKEIGTFFYNRGLYDAQTILEQRFDSITQAIYEIEVPTKFVNH